MGKQLLVLILLSLIIVFFGKEFGSIVHFIGSWQISLGHYVKDLLPWSDSDVNRTVSSTVVLLLLPLIIGLVPAFIYWLIERKEMPHLTTVIWVAWIIAALMFITK